MYDYPVDVKHIKVNSFYKMVDYMKGGFLIVLSSRMLIGSYYIYS